MTEREVLLIALVALESAMSRCRWDRKLSHAIDVERVRLEALPVAA